MFDDSKSFRRLFAPAAAVFLLLFPGMLRAGEAAPQQGIETFLKIIRTLEFPVKDPARRQRALESLLAFCEYFPARFYLPWSADHLKVISRLEECVRSGGRFALAMPRGGGKTSLCGTACLWALYPRRCARR